MTMNHLPPQAYTTETVSKAYAWLRTQPESIRQVARSVEILVGLYLKAQRHGDEALQRPSILKFKDDLRDIQGLMEKFETGEAKAESADPGSSQSQQIAPSPPVPVQKPSGPSPQARPKSQDSFNSAPLTPRNPSPAQSSQAHRTPELKELLDRKSWAMIQEVALTFNLSDESEALRLLISIGYNQSHKLSSR